MLDNLFASESNGAATETDGFFATESSNAIEVSAAGVELNGLENGTENGTHGPITSTKSASSRIGQFSKTEKIDLTFENVRYTVPVGKGKSKSTKVILDGLHGSASSGTMTAIMGPTGSGKTSLLNVLAQRVSKKPKGATLTGTLRANGEVINQRHFKRVASYVQQDDAMGAFLTVHETLMVAAHFQLPPDVTKERKEQYVADIISELGLANATNTRIGDAQLRGVSGGERKRANIGIELIKNPSLLFLDEPTSGLDSFQAQSVMECMNDLAKNGRTIVASIHQPRSSIYSMFDRLLLISQGRTIYSGTASRAVAYFQSCGHSCPQLYNPADFFLDITSPDFRNKELEHSSLERVARLAEFWGKVPGGTMIERSPSTDSNSTDAFAVGGAPGVVLPDASARTELVASTHGSYHSSWTRQFRLIFWRSCVNAWRDRSALVGKIVSSMFFALFLGGVYSNISYDQKSIQDRIGVLFFFTINQTFGNAIGVLNTFGKEMVVVERERASKSYSLSAYYIAKMVAELPFNLLGPIVFGSIVYFLVGLNPEPEAFLCFIIILILVSCCAVGLGLAVTSASPSPEAAVALAPIIVVLMILMGGFYINIESLPEGIRWVPNLSIMRHAFEGLVINEFEGVELSCKDVDDGDACIETGEEVIDRLFVNPTSIFGIEGRFALMIALLIYMMIVNFVAYITLALSSRTYLTMDESKERKAK